MKLGIVCEGGASRTVFSCGVLDVFLQEGLLPDYFVGVSAGIAYGVSYLSGQKGRNLTLIEKYMPDKRYMGIRHLFDREEKAYYNTKFVFDEVPNKLLPFDYKAFARFPGKVEAVVTNIHTGRAEYLEVPRGKEMRDTLVASCSLPILFQPVRIGRRYYLDGGISDSIPFEHAIEEGCDRIIVVLTREREYVKTVEKGVRLTNSLYKKYPNIVDAMESRADRYNECMRRLKELEQKGEIYVITPDTTYGVGRTESDPTKLRRLYDEGVRLAKQQKESWKNYLRGE